MIAEKFCQTRGSSSARDVMHLRIRSLLFLLLPAFVSRPRSLPANGRRVVQRLLCLAFLLGVARLWGAPHPHKSVLVLVSDEPNLPAVTMAMEALRTELLVDDPAAISLFTEYLDLNRFESPAFQAEVLPREKEKYRAVPLDLILCVSLPALQLTLAQRDRLWPGVPLSFIGVDAEDLEEVSLPADVHGQVMHYDFEGTAQLALKLLPGTKHVAVVSGSALRDQLAHHQVISIVRRLNPTLDVIDEGGLSYDDLGQRLSSLPKETIVLWTEITLDRDGRQFVPRDAVAALAPRTNAPVFAAFGTYMGMGIMGGDLTDYRVAGRDGAVFCRQILYEGRKTSAQVESGGNQIELDWRQLHKWNIADAQIPPGSAVLFRTPGLWEQHQTAIVAALGLVLLIAGLLWQRFQWKSASAGMKRLGGLLIHSQEEERASIARELHDDFSQRLALQSIELEQLRKSLPESAVKERETALKMLKGTREMSADMRSLSHQLHSSRLELIGLGPALSGLCQEIGDHYRIEVRYTEPEAVPDLTKDQGLCLFRVAQEALANVVKHSRATGAQVTLGVNANYISLRISDTGKGFDPELESTHEGIGLLSMRERVQLLGGRFSVRSEPMRGTEILAELPLSTSAKRSGGNGAGGGES